MNLYNVINEIEKVDPEVYERLDGRRAALKNFTGIAGKVAVAAVPFMLGSMFKKAYGQTGNNADIIAILNFALTLEYLESEFYKRGVSTAPIPAADLAGFQTIRDHEIAHVADLRSTITALGGTPVTLTAASFDFTGHGAFPTVFTDYNVFLAVSNAFEDTGVRAYKGQATGLMSNNDVLTAALQIHSVEARHAAHIRRLRAAAAGIKPWITSNNAGGLPAAIYAGEENTAQVGISIVNINSTGISANAASEAFDEPLTKEQVMAIVQPFLA